MDSDDYSEKFMIKSSYSFGSKNETIHYYEYLSPNTLVHAWDSGKLFLEFIDQETELFKNKRVLDVGCGTGLAGIGSLLKRATDCYFFDFLPEKYLIPLISSNIKLNKIEADYSIFSEDWRDPSQKFFDALDKKIDIVFAGDCLYEEENYLGFFGLMSELYERNPDIHIFITYQERGNPDPIMSYADGFNMELKDPKDFLDENFYKYMKYKFVDLYLFRLVKKSEASSSL